MNLNLNLDLDLDLESGTWTLEPGTWSSPPFQGWGAWTLGTGTWKLELLALTLEPGESLELGERRAT